MRQSRTFIPRILDAFSRDIRPFDMADPSHGRYLDYAPEINAAEVVVRYVGLLQAADLSLSQRDAGAMLVARLIADRRARLNEIEAAALALINTPV